MWTFVSATNGNLWAICNMSKAYQNGLGTSTNQIAAYA